MRKHTITAFTFAPGDVLYYIQKGQIKSVTLTEEHRSEERRVGKECRL